MENIVATIKTLLVKRSELQARLNLLAYDGTPEIKTISNQKYLYVRKRVLDKAKSVYVGDYSDELYNVLLRNNEEAKALRKEIRAIDRQLATLGFAEKDLSPRVILNMEFARANMKKIIYDQAILEGLSTTFPDTEAILENGIVRNLKTEDVQKIINLKHAWEFILDKDALSVPSDYYLASYIARLVNEGLIAGPDGGRIRAVPVTIGGSSYVPPIPLETQVKEDIDDLLAAEMGDLDKAIALALYVMKTQIYNDGNKRTAVIYANHYLISKGAGLLVIDHSRIGEFKNHLVNYYEGKDLDSVKAFLKSCWMNF